MFESVAAAAVYLMHGSNLVYLMVGVLVGLAFGVIPGLGGATAIALLLPLTFGMEADQAIVLMGGVMGSVAIGGSMTAILVNTPGTAPNAATCFDGYPLTREGKAGLAIGAAAAASSLGGLVGLLILVFALPLAKSVVMWFGPPAIFMLTVLGLTSLTVASGNLLRGLIAACVGLFAGFVGYDGIGGTERYTAGIEYLWDGLSIVPVLIGMFAVAEMLNLYVRGGPIARNPSAGDVRVVGTRDGIKAVLANPRALLSGSTIGTLIGMVPGVGGTVAAFLSYSFVAQTSSNNEKFGSGDIRGVIGPEAANNAKDGGALIPTLAFGVPGSAEMALFLGVLVLHGLDPGPMLLLEKETTIFVLILALLAATLSSAALVLLVARYLARIAYVDSSVLIPCVIAISFVGAYALQGSMGDVFVTAFFGLLGYLMIRTGYPRITFVIAFVLSDLMETNFMLSMIRFRGDWLRFFTDTTTLVLLAMAVLALVIPARQALRKRRAAS